MSKTKDKKKGKHRSEKPVRDDVRFDVPPQVAGIAAAALRQVNTPAFQQLIATSLGAAGQAMSAMAQRSAAERAGAPVPPTPPTPPTAPAPPTAPTPPEPPFAPESRAAYRPHFETPPIQLSPEAAQAIERVATQATEAVERAAAHASRAIEGAAAAFEQWVEKTKPRPPGA